MGQKIMWKELVVLLTLLISGATFLFNVMNDGDAEQRERDKEDAAYHARQDADIRALGDRVSRIEGKLDK